MLVLRPAVVGDVRGQQVLRGGLNGIGDIAEQKRVAEVEADAGAPAVELIERSVAVKVEVVSRDLRESGPREILNYGHTLGHAVERLEDYRIPHGHAVGIGMVFAAALGKVAGTIDGEALMRHKVLLSAIGLPTTYRADALPELIELMRIDKKSRGATLRFVVLDGIGKAVMLEDPDPAMLEAAYREVAQR